MIQLPFYFRRLTAIAAGVALLSACGGGDSKDAEGSGAPAGADAVAVNDDADAATLAQVDALVAANNAAVESMDRSAQTTGAPIQPGPLPGDSGATAGFYPGLKQSNLVANDVKYGAKTIEPLLKNPWGIAIRPAGFGGHFWVAAAGTGKSIQYVGDVGNTPLVQDALKLVDTGGAATGVAFNPGTRFVVTQSHPNGAITNPAKFLFANATGTITAWTERTLPGGGFDHPADSVKVVDGTARLSSFLGLAVSPSAERVFAADFGAQPSLRVYDGAFVERTPLANPFRPGGIPQPGAFEAFNVQTIGNHVFAMYGRHVAPGTTTPPPAEGRLAEFDDKGRFVTKWRTRGYLNYPWGVAQAPKDFGQYSECLLVGNFGDGTIVAFHPKLKVALDYVRDTHGKRLVIDGLWGLQFGNGASLGQTNHLYFAAGPNREADGVFGKLQANPNTRFASGPPLCS